MNNKVLFLLVLCCMQAAAQEQEEVDGREICEDGSSTCDTQCNGNDCNSCSNGNCCKTVNCNSCVNNCRDSCSNSACENNCVNSCSSNSCNGCNTCRNTNCRRSCNKCVDSTREEKVIVIKSDESGASSSNPINNNISNTPEVNITTIIDVENYINNTNHVHIPVFVNNTNINHIELKQEPRGSKDVEIIKISENRTSDRMEDNKCCMVIPPKQCRYETEELKCQQNPYKSCSPICRSPVVIPHPVPVYIPRPYPVPIRVPYPTNHTQIRYVQVPHPVQVPVPVTRVVKEPIYIPQHIPYPVERQVYVPQPVPQPFPVPVSKPIYITQSVPQPVYIPKIVEVPRYINRPCPMVYYQGQQMPSCSSAFQSQQYLGTSQQFLIDQFSERLQYPVTPQCSVTNKYPWLSCNNVQLQNCGGCYYCNGQFNSNCIKSNRCPSSCSKTIQSLHLQNQIGHNLDCKVSHSGQVSCS